MGRRQGKKLLKKIDKILSKVGRKKATDEQLDDLLDSVELELFTKCLPVGIAVSMLAGNTDAICDYLKRHEQSMAEAVTDRFFEEYRGVDEEDAEEFAIRIIRFVRKYDHLERMVDLYQGVIE